jgi:hypothetical protein
MCLRLTMRTDLVIGRKYHGDHIKSRDVPVLFATEGVCFWTSRVGLIMSTDKGRAEVKPRRREGKF